MLSNLICYWVELLLERVIIGGRYRGRWIILEILVLGCVGV